MIYEMIKPCRTIRIFPFLLLLLPPVFSQSLTSIDLLKVPPGKVREYIVSRSFDQLNEFSSIHASWKTDIDKHSFYVIEETFYLKKKLSTVWDSYRHTSPAIMWNCRSFSFGLLICKCSKSIIYPNSSSKPDLDTGQVYFLNLRLLKGLVNVPVAFEITNIDTGKRIMEFSYIDGNKSRGKQILKFYDDGNGRTRIVHLSYFKSDSWLRDKFFYPYFHYRFIEEFHRNMQKIIRRATPEEIS